MEKKYSNDDITIVWQAKKCIHAGECVKALPEVYDPKGKPWIKIENASSEALKAQVKLCPSGALTYYNNSDKNNTTMSNNSERKANIMTNGPIIVEGPLRIVHPDGKEELKEGPAAICRCGASGNKPFCDGSHKESGFEG